MVFIIIILGGGAAVRAGRFTAARGREHRKVASAGALGHEEDRDGEVLRRHRCVLREVCYVVFMSAMRAFSEQAESVALRE